jgi:hypothetical protein
MSMLSPSGEDGTDGTVRYASCAGHYPSGQTLPLADAGWTGGSEPR